MSLRRSRWPAARLACAGLLLGALLAGCEIARQPQPAAPPPEAAWPAFDYTAARARGLPVYALDSARSRVDVVVGRDGPLARFGHDHAIVLASPRGRLLYPQALEQARADLRFAVTDLQVDPAEARARHNLDTQPDAAAVAGTRDNLLQHVLAPQQWPWIDVSLAEFRRDGDVLSASLDIAVNGQHTVTRQPFTLEVDGTGARATGHFSLAQSQLGLQPFSTLGGGLRVADTMEIYIELRGNLFN